MLSSRELRHHHSLHHHAANHSGQWRRHRQCLRRRVRLGNGIQPPTTKTLFSGTSSTPAFVDLDNEPDLWNSTHLEVQGPTEITPAAYIAKTLSVSEALKTTFPNIVIFGPSHYGFLGVYNFQGGVTGTTPTGENWFPDEYFQALATASATFGRPLVDVYDFHWYPEDYDAGSTR